VFRYVPGITFVPTTHVPSPNGSAAVLGRCGAGEATGAGEALVTTGTLCTRRGEVAGGASFGAAIGKGTAVGIGEASSIALYAAISSAVYLFCGARLIGSASGVFDGAVLTTSARDGEICPMLDGVEDKVDGARAGTALDVCTCATFVFIAL
jgi:hypothetical protein